MAPQCGLMHAEKDDTQRNRQALLAGLLAGAVGFVAFLAYRRHHRARVGCHACVPDRSIFGLCRLFGAG